MYDYIIFIYTFKNICKEDNSLALGDDTAKIFLNTDSKLNDVSKELKAFLDYVAGKKSEDIFIKKLEAAVKKARLNKEWRIEFMTWNMQMLESRKEGEEKGIEKGIFGAVSICKDLGLSDSEILKRIQEKYSLSEKEVLKYLQENKR